MIQPDPGIAIRTPQARLSGRPVSAASFEFKSLWPAPARRRAGFQMASDDGVMSALGVTEHSIPAAPYIQRDIPYGNIRCRIGIAWSGRTQTMFTLEPA